MKVKGNSEEAIAVNEYLDALKTKYTMDLNP